MQHSDLGAKHKSLLFPRHLVRAWAWAFAATSNEAWTFLFWFVIFGENLASEVISGLSSILFLLEEGLKKKKHQELQTSASLAGVISGQRAPGTARQSHPVQCPKPIPLFFSPPKGLDRLPRIPRSQRREGHTGKSCFGWLLR